MKHGMQSLLLSAMLALGGTSVEALTPERGAVLTQHVHEEVRAAKPVGTMPAETVLRFDMLLPLGSPEKLDEFLAGVYDPANAAYRHFVTPAEFTARFGPSQAAWNELLAYAKQSGFVIVGGSRDEMDLRLSGTVRAIEAAFGVRMRVYRHPTESRTYYSPDAEPTVGMRAPVWHISGLDNFSLPRPRLQMRAAVTAKPLTTTGACPGNSYCGSDMRSAYYGGNALTGAGQSIGLVEFYGYDIADLTAYFATSGQTNAVPVNGISTDGSSVSCVYARGCDDTEQTLDMTQALGMAPGLAQLNVYVGASDTAILSAMSVPPAGSKTGRVDAQLSCSWGWGPADPATDDPLFKKFAAQGQSFLTAAGDAGAYTATSQAVYPADDVNVTVVGGTDLSSTGPGGAWLGETAWSDGGGGSFAPDDIQIPAWQTTALATFNSHSSKAGVTSLRNSPDVAGEANFDFYVCADQRACTSNQYGGTSFAAPMWAGYLALVNQQAVLSGQTSVGFLNPTLYATGNAAGSGYAQAFHDITAGANGYPAVAGYDLATGWGSPNGAGLIAALVGAGAPSFTLTAGSAASVAAGGTTTLKLTSAVAGNFDGAIALSAGNVPNGVTVNFSPASITGAGSTTVTFQAAAGVPAGAYAITLTGTSPAGNAGATSLRSVAALTLTVTSPNFALTANGALTVPVGAMGSVVLSSTASGGFASAIALTASGQPPGVTVGFSPASIAAGGTSTVSFLVAATATPGLYPITVTGTSGSLVQRVTVSLTIPTPAFSLAASAATLSLTQGLNTTLSLSSSASGGFAGQILLTASGQPAGVAVNFAPATIGGGGSSVVTVAVGVTAAAGSYPIVLTGTSGGLQQRVIVTLNVGAASFTITPAATSLASLQGASASVGLSATVTGALNGPLTLSVSGLPVGVTAAWSASVVVPPANAVLTLNVAANAAAGSYPIVISGVGDGITRTATVALVVAAAAKPPFVFSVGTTALSLGHGTSTGFTVQTTLTGATAPAIALAVSGLPSGVTAGFAPATIGGAGTSIVTLTAAATAKPGLTVLTFSATAGSSTQSSTVNLTVD